MQPPNKWQQQALAEIGACSDLSVAVVFEAWRIYNVVLVSGDPGCGKSTLVANMSQHPDHFVYCLTKRIQALSPTPLISYTDCGAGFRPGSFVYCDHVETLQANGRYRSVERIKRDVWDVGSGAQIKGYPVLVIVTDARCMANMDPI